MVILMKKTKIIWLAFLLIFLVGATLFFSQLSKEHDTYSYINRVFINENQTISTYSVDSKADSSSNDVVKGRELLTESIGLYMEYLLAADKKKEFDRQFRVLTSTFLDEDGFMYWKRFENGKVNANSNSLVDDLRIMKVLYQASERYHKTSYKIKADKIRNFILMNQTNHDYLVDFYDISISKQSDTLHLFYIDTDALDYFPINLKSKNRDVLLNTIDSNHVFFPESFSIKNNQYILTKDANMIEQTLIAINLNRAGHKPNLFLSFIKDEWRQNQKIYGSYSKTIFKPSSDFESSSVYALLCILFSEVGDRKTAEDLQSKLTEMKSNGGGYLSSSSAHFFDNILPLIAETKKRKLI